MLYIVDQIPFHSKFLIHPHCLPVEWRPSSSSSWTFGESLQTPGPVAQVGAHLYWFHIPTTTVGMSSSLIWLYFNTNTFYTGLMKLQWLFRKRKTCTKILKTIQCALRYCTFLVVCKRQVLILRWCSCYSTNAVYWVICYMCSWSVILSLRKQLHKCWYIFTEWTLWLQINVSESLTGKVTLLMKPSLYFIHRACPCYGYLQLQFQFILECSS